LIPQLPDKSIDMHNPPHQHARKIVLLILLLGLPVLMTAQMPVISSSTVDVNPSTTRMHKVFAHDQDYYYVIKFFANQYYLQKLDNNLDPLAEKPLSFIRGSTLQLESVVHFYVSLCVLFMTRINEIVCIFKD
jgi:hypothetical protein